MAKVLSDILKGVNKSKIVPGSTGDDPGVDYAEKSKDGRDFVAQHKIEKHEDRVGNGDDVYNASKVKKAKMERHGHDPDPKAKTAYKLANEAKDTREYDYEGEMAISQIKSIMNHSQQLMGMLKPDTNLPEWVQSKITLAKDYIQTAADYYATEMTEDSKCNMTEAGTMCEVHGMKSCSEDKSAGATDKEPRYNGKKKEGRQLITDRKLKESNGEKVKDEFKNFHDEFKSHPPHVQTKITSNLRKGMSYRKAIDTAKKDIKEQTITDRKLKEEQIEENLGKAMKKMKFWYKGTGPDGSGDPREMKKKLKADPELTKKVASSSEKLGGMAELQRRVAKKMVKEEQIEEREMTAADKKREEKLKSKYDDSGMKANMQKQYGDEKGKKVYFAYIRKKAMKSEQADTHVATPSSMVGDTGRV
jgi:hypothetical protein